MNTYELIAPCHFGLESVLKKEIYELGYEIISVEDGKVTFEGDAEAICRANINLRTAERVLLKVGQFNAVTFTELFDQTKELPWEEFIPADGKFWVTKANSVNSKLFSSSDIQSIVKKAIVERLKLKYRINWFKEDGESYPIRVTILKDVVTIALDTTGNSLHKRGYRVQQVMAPLKETMAAALIMLSYWKPDRVLLDPCCGSGTIAIEAALIAKNIAPGLMRHFAAEKWDFIDKELWKKERREARLAIKQDFQPKIYGSDINANAVKMSMENADNAGVRDCIKFAQIPFNKLKLPCNYGVCISNPPYAERMGNLDDVERLYRDMGKLFNHNKTWSTYFITSHEGFEKLYGRRADKKRKLFNGNVKTDYYQFYGERPPKKK